jgi:hypothetical protein
MAHLWREDQERCEQLLREAREGLLRWQSASYDSEAAESLSIKRVLVKLKSDCKTGIVYSRTPLFRAA